MAVLAKPINKMIRISPEESADFKSKDLMLELLLKNKKRLAK